MKTIFGKINLILVLENTKFLMVTNQKVLQGIKYPFEDAPLSLKSYSISLASLSNYSTDSIVLRAITTCSVSSCATQVDEIQM